MRFGLGERVLISGTARKDKDWRGYSRAIVTYEEGPPPVRHNYPEPKHYTEGVIVGRRTVMDGDATWEDGAMYCPRAGTARDVWLVAFDMRMKPVMCFDHQVQPMLTQGAYLHAPGTHPKR